MNTKAHEGRVPVAGLVQQPVRPADPERVAFEAWLNPGSHAGNVSPWVEEPGRYQQDTHQLAWLAWRAGRKQERERWSDAVRALMCSDIGVQTRHKLEAGQGTNTLDGQAWLRALQMLREGPN